MTENSILLALDGSAESRYAAEVAWMVAEGTGCDVVAQHVIDSHAMWSMLIHHKAGFIGSGLYIAAGELILTQLRDIGEAIADAYERFVPENVKSETIFSEGDVAAEILDKLSTMKMLVIGHRAQCDRLPNWESLSALVASRSEKPVLVVQKRLKSWSAARLVIGRQAFDVEWVFHFAQWANKLKLTKEVYCLQGADPENSVQMVRYLNEDQTHNPTPVVMHNALDASDYTRFGVHERETLVVIPTMIGDDGFAYGHDKTIDEILESFAGSSILFWPVSPAISRSSDRENRKTAAKLITIEQ